MAGWVEGLVESWGAFGVALLMFLENVFPPIPSEIIMPLAGYVAAQGEASLIVLILAGAAGAFAGALAWCCVGRAIDEDRLKAWCAKHGRWLTMSPRDIDRADDWFDRYGGWAVFVGRLIPTVRTLISVPAGVSRMPLPRFCLFTLAGTFLWTTLLTMAGYWLGAEFEQVRAWIGPVSNAVLVAIVLIYCYRVATFRKDADPERARRRETP